MGYAINPLIYKNPFCALRNDFTPISLLGDVSAARAGPSVGQGDLRLLELIQLAKTASPPSPTLRAETYYRFVAGGVVRSHGQAQPDPCRLQAPPRSST